MTKTVTLRIDVDTIKRFDARAKIENRTISNFIETAALKYVEEAEAADEFETDEILKDEQLLKRLRKGTMDARKRRGRFA
ncbi:MAG: ribbon-helix-helix protein, CopG family [Candidatus Margulisiibacteriota bacterium]